MSNWLQLTDQSAPAAHLSKGDEESGLLLCGGDGGGDWRLGGAPEPSSAAGSGGGAPVEALIPPGGAKGGEAVQGSVALRYRMNRSTGVASGQDSIGGPTQDNSQRRGAAIIGRDLTSSGLGLGRVPGHAVLVTQACDHHMSEPLETGHRLAHVGRVRAKQLALACQGERNQACVGRSAPFPGQRWGIAAPDAWTSTDCRFRWSVTCCWPVLRSIRSWIRRLEAPPASLLRATAC